MTNSIIGIFEDREVKSKIVNDLEVSNIPSNRVSILGPDQKVVEPLKKSSSNTVWQLELGWVIGCLVGAIVGTIYVGFNWQLMTPMIAVMTIISGTAAGSYIGFLVEAMAFPKYDIGEGDVRYYEDEAKKGRTVVGVDARDPDELKHVEEIMEKLGAVCVKINPAQKIISLILGIVFCSTIFATGSLAQSSTPNRLFVQKMPVAGEVGQAEKGSKQEVAAPTSNVFASRQIGAEYPVSYFNKVVLLTSFLLLLFACVITTQYGLEAKDKRKWISIFVRPNQFKK